MTPDQTINPAADGAVPSRSYGSGPGAMIRAARERARLGLDQVAQQTKLTRATLDALERDDFGVLTEAVYVRGYYRKISKALGLSEQELIRAYEGLVAPKAPPAPTKLLLGSGDNGPSRSRRRANVIYVVMAVLVVLLIGVGVKLASHGGIVHPATSTTDVPAESDAAPARPSNAGVSDLSSQSTRNDGEADPTLGDRAVVAGAAPGGDAAATSAPAGDSGQSDLPDSLAMDFKVASWVRVEDGSGKLLLSGIIQAGAHQVVSGKPPYAVFLGKAPGVSLEFEGKSVNIAPYIKDNATARFSVP